MKYLVFYTIVSILQVPIMTCFANIFIVNREKSEYEGWGYWQWEWSSILTTVIPYHLIAFDFLFEVGNHLPPAAFTIVPILVLISCVLGVVFAYYICFKKRRNISKDHRESLFAAFSCMVAYAIAIAAYTWWIFNR